MNMELRTISRNAAFEEVGATDRPSTQFANVTGPFTLKENTTSKQFIVTK